MTAPPVTTIPAPRTVPGGLVAQIRRSRHPVPSLAEIEFILSGPYLHYVLTPTATRPSARP